MVRNREPLDRLRSYSSGSLTVEGLRNRFIGERCFIIGNGPSLKQTDLVRLKAEFTIGLNRIYLNYSNMGFEPTFYCCVNSKVVDQFAAEIDQVHSIKFVADRARDQLQNHRNTFFFDSIPEVGFNPDLSTGKWYEGWTVTYCAMQVAFYLGFSEVILVGVDHYFKDSGPPDTATTAVDSDVNHFHPDYFGEGTVWEYPNLTRSEQSYEIAKNVYEWNGRSLLDATIGGHLQIFDKCDYETITSRLKKPSPLFLDLQNIMLEDLTQQEASLVKRHPHPHAIFLPTEKIEPQQRVSGLKRVIDIYENKFESTYSAQLKALRQQYKGKKRAFVIGNGPSLNKTDLSLLKDEITFGVNGIFLKAEELGFKPTFYVVEDHLVAEDRQEAINAFSGPIKIFPIYLAYCLEEGDDTVFYNHVPRKSYPDGYDFSTNASDRTYSGCTVTFSCLQLAYYFGFEEIYLIGVDCNYEIPKDVEETKEYNVATLDMKSDDINHFHPDYFGKGFRWHDPQADKMREAYKEARKVCEANGVTIYNATVGGKLEVFPRVDYYSLFSDTVLYPRVLLIDMTRTGDNSATGQVKQNLFSGWQAGKLLQVYSAGLDKLGVYSNASPSEAQAIPDVEEVLAICDRFNPDVIYYRPIAEHPHLHDFANQALKKYDVPYLVHIMDDWPERLRYQDPVRYAEVNQSLRTLLAGAAACLSICSAMSEAFEERYGVQFTPIANCVNESDWETAIAQIVHQKTSDRPFTIRYVGSLASDMTLESIVDVGRAVSALQSTQSVRLEIHTRKLWRDAAENSFLGLSGVDFHDSDLSPEEYRKLLAGADCLLIAYNFDPDSIRYVKYSMANKMPECLASANPVLVYGPIEMATVAYAAESEGTQVITERNIERLKSAINELISDPEQTRKLGAAGQTHAFNYHSMSRVQTYFYGLIRSAAPHRQSSLPTPSLQPMQSPISGPFPRESHAHFDETQYIAQVMSDKPMGSVMIDVGAHYGGSLRHFIGDGWKVYAFEPDPSNRQALLKKVKDNPLVVVDIRAVSDRAGEILPFFTSEESTGISGLSAFRETHQETCQVVTTTVKDICEEHQLTHVDFLKIDTEGFDWMVLKGVPWDTLKPDVIECEFEDRKTVPLGYTFDDIAQYLVDKGYSVFVSEWHPVIRYGIKHDWHRLVPYPCSLTSADSWGNLLAFRNPPSAKSLKEVANQLVKINSVEASGSTKSVPSIVKPLSSKPLVLETVNSSSNNGNSNSTNGVQKTVEPQVLEQPSVELNGNGGRNGEQKVLEKYDQKVKENPVAKSDSITSPVQDESVPVDLSQDASQVRLGTSLLKRIARYYKRWPLGVAILAAGLNSAAMIDGVPFRWAFTGGGTALMLFLVGHAASKADVSLESAEQAQGLAHNAQTTANTAQSKAERSHKRADTGSNQGKRAMSHSQEVQDIVKQTRIQAKSFEKVAKQTTSDLEKALRNVEQKVTQSVMKSESALVQVQQLGLVSKASVAKIQQATEIANQATEIANQATKTAHQAEQVAQQAEQMATQAGQSVNNVNQMVTKVERIANQNGQAITQVERSLRKPNNSSNVALFQPFNRQLSPDHISTFENFWLPALNLDLNPRSLGYLAHRICLTEDLCSGRLATSVEDMLLRILVTRSVAGKTLSILEIGSLFGINLGILYETCRDYFDSIHLNAIDPLDGYYGESKFDLITNVPVTRSVFEHNMRTLDVAETDVTLIQGLSTEPKVLEAAGEKQYNLFVIDGDHSYTGVKFDFEHYLAAVDVGGYIIFDDYSTDHWPEIADYVNNEAKNHPCVEFVGASWRTAVFKVVRKNLK